ncbi:predicted protein, partial [Nematostella vectensis]
DKRVLEESKATTRQVDNRYQVQLPWKPDVTYVPDSHKMASRRLKWTEREFSGDPILKE